MSRVSVVMRTDGHGRGLLRLIEYLRSDDAVAEVVILDSGGPDEVLRRSIESVARFDDIVVVAVAPDRSIASWRNAGIAATSADAVFFVDPGWHPSQEWASRAVVALDERRDAVLVTSGYRRIGFGGQEEVITPAGHDLASLLGDADVFHPCTIFRRSAWQDLSGFDEALVGFDLTDFWIRLVSNSRGALVIDEALVVHRPDETRHYRADLHRRRHVPALTALYRKHENLFVADPDSVLSTREGALYALSGTYARIKERRARMEAEVDALALEIRELTDVLHAHGRQRVDWGDLRRTSPISPEWGADRGKPIDRYYIESFLYECMSDVRGDVLEVQESDYTLELGGDDLVHSDVVDIDPTNPRATFVADLRRMETVPDGSYDCFILTQTVHVIDDMRAVIAQAHRVLKPGGVLLSTFPCLSRVCLEYGEDGDFWRLTEAGVRNLLESAFAPADVSTKGYGNVLTATAFLYGLACDELTNDEFAVYDPFHPVLIGARALKAADNSENRAPAVRRDVEPRSGTVLAYHRVDVERIDPHGLCVSPDAFRAQMQALVENQTVLSLDELVERARARDLEPGSVAVTFDDGYLDALEVASPILTELGVPATFFVVSEGLEKELTYWWDALVSVFHEAENLPESIEISIAGTRHTHSTATPDAIRMAHDAIYSDLIRCSPARRDAALRALAAWGDVDLAPRGRRRPMLASEVRELAARKGHTIGAHGVHHLALSHQPYETQQREIMEARTALERVVEGPVSMFAYPYGDVCETAVSLAGAAGYVVAVTCQDASVHWRVNPLKVPRVDGRSWRPE